MKKGIFLLIAFAWIACEKKNDSDYRDPFTGLFYFATLRTSAVLCYDTVPPCMDGWYKSISDTSYYSGKVEIFDTLQLKICFDNKLVDDTSYRTIYPILSNDGILTLPGYPYTGPDYYNGYYKGYDTLVIELKFRHGMGGYEEYEIKGIRQDF